MGIMVLFDSSKNKPRFRPKLTYNVLSKEQKNRYVTLCFKEKTPLTKEMVSVLVDHILVGRRDPLTKQTPIEIHWNF